MKEDKYQPVLTDSRTRPDEKAIFSHIGRRSSSWEKLFGLLGEKFPELKGEWRFYRDGKSWLYKCEGKSRTVFWLSVYGGGFRVTFYFGAKAAKEIAGSGLPDELKGQYAASKGALRSVCVDVKNGKDVKNILALAALRLAIK